MKADDQTMGQSDNLEDASRKGAKATVVHLHADGAAATILVKALPKLVQRAFAGVRRCEGIKRNGLQCHRFGVGGWCWQHEDQAPAVFRNERIRFFRSPIYKEGK